MERTSAQKEARKKIEVFCCYARKDQLLLQELKKHLIPLQRDGLITFWVDTDMNAGVEWEKEIHFHLNTAHIILLLISPDSLASNYWYQIEMKRAIQRHERGEAHVIPIILRPANWKNTPFAKLQALPREAKPITTWDNYDEAFLDIVEGLRKVAEECLLPALLTAPQSEPLLSSQEPLVLHTAALPPSITSSSLEGPMLDGLLGTDTFHPSVLVSTTKEENLPVSASNFSLLEVFPKNVGTSKQKSREVIIAYMLLGGICLVILVRGILSLSYPAFSDKKVVIQTYCTILVHQDYTQASTILGLSQGGVTLGKELVSSRAVFEALASYADNQEGRVIVCTIDSITPVAIHTEQPSAVCAPSGTCSIPPKEITTTFACTLQITRRVGKPYMSRLLVDVQGPADNSSSPVAYITAIEAL